jgi:hypothetical protein
MWVFPLAAGAVVLGVLAGWTLVFGALGSWTRLEFEVFWVLGAVLNVPFLAAGEIDLLVRRPPVTVALWLILVFVCAYAVATTRTALFDPAALAQDLPSGKEVFGAGSAAHRLPQLISIPSYLILVGGAIWSAWRMRGRPELRDRFMGTLWIAIGATVIAGVGSAFAATGNLPVFSLSLLVGIATMYWGFLRASRSRSPAPAA